MKKRGLILCFVAWYTFFVLYCGYVFFTQRPGFFPLFSDIILHRDDDVYSIYYAQPINMNTEEFHAVAIKNDNGKIIPLESTYSYKTHGSLEFIFGDRDSVYSYHRYIIQRHDLRTGRKTVVLPKFSVSFFQGIPANDVPYQLHDWVFSDKNDEFVAIYSDNSMKRKSDDEKVSFYLDVYDHNLQLLETVSLGIEKDPISGIISVGNIGTQQIQLFYRSFEANQFEHYIYYRTTGEVVKQAK